MVPNVCLTYCILNLKNKKKTYDTFSVLFLILLKWHQSCPGMSREIEFCGPKYSEYFEIPVLLSNRTGPKNQHPVAVTWTYFHHCP